MEFEKQDLFEAKHCSPDSKNTNGSCLDDDIIKKVARILNKLKKKNENIQEINCKESIPKIHDNICANIKRLTNCNSEACMMSIDDLMKRFNKKEKQRFQESFKPVMPGEWKKDTFKNQWVSTEEIDDIIFQEDDAHRNFYFYGAVPNDFMDCEVSNLCSFNLKRHIKNKHKRIAAVFNTDDHNKDGQHWIAFYVDVDGENLDGNPGIYYFDSYGREPGENIQKLIDKILGQAKKLNLDMKYLYNDHQYQKKGAECGMYAIHFIKQMLKGVSFTELLNSSKLTDDMMVNLRDADKGGYLLGFHVMKGGKLIKKKKTKNKKNKKKTKKTKKR